MYGSKAIEGKYLRPCPPEKLQQAVSIIREFAAKYGWTKFCTIFNQISVMLVPDQETLRSHLQAIGELEDDGPPGLVAAALSKMIIAVEPVGVEKVRPEYLAFDKGWERLLAHELAHLLHEALVAGNERRLGPRWFFEGFACMAAGQNFGYQFDSESSSQVLEAIKQEGREQYARFEAAVRYFCRSHDLTELVERAGYADFEEWLVNSTPKCTTS